LHGTNIAFPCFEVNPTAGSGGALKITWKAVIHTTERVASLTWMMLAPFPGHRKNGLATYMSPNCYFCCQKVGSTNQISECGHMLIVKPNNCVMHSNIAVTPIPFQYQSLDRVSLGTLHDDFFVLLFNSRTNSNSCFHEQESQFSQLEKL